jgi:hypothetical protein
MLSATAIYHPVTLRGSNETAANLRLSPAIFRTKALREEEVGGYPSQGEEITMRVVANPNKALII